MKHGAQWFQLAQREGWQPQFSTLQPPANIRKVTVDEALKALVEGREVWTLADGNWRKIKLRRSFISITEQDGAHISLTYFPITSFNILILNPHYLFVAD